MTESASYVPVDADAALDFGGYIVARGLLSLIQAGYTLKQVVENLEDVLANDFQNLPQGVKNKIDQLAKAEINGS